MKSGWKTPLQLLISVAAALAITVAVGAGALNWLDRTAQDALFQHPRATSEDILIIGIDEDTLTQLGPFGTSYRMYIADALMTLASDPDHLPAAVGLDVTFGGSTNEGVDNYLAMAAKQLGCVVTASQVEFDKYTGKIIGYTEPYDALCEASEQAQINIMPDSDSIMRHAILYLEPNGKKVPSFAWKLAEMLCEKQGKTLTPPPTAGSIPFYYVPYAGRPGSFNNGASLRMLIDEELDPAQWTGKIVLIGPYAASLGDAFFTSIDKGAQMLGVEYHANVIQCLLENNYKREARNPAQLAVLFVVCAVAAWFFIRLKVAPSVAVCAGVIVLSLIATYVVYALGIVLHVTWIPLGVLILFLAALAWHYRVAARERRALELEKARISTELALATRIQANTLPKTFPPFPDRHEFDLYASMTPAKEVGGDLYDFFLIDDDHLCLVIGDVSGKGVPASLFMMLASALIHHVAMHEQSPAKILTAVNAEICSRNPEEMFVTVWLGVLEISTGRLVAANAGHEYPAVKHPDGSFDLLKDRHGFVIGGMEGIRYREYELQLEPGARVFVYTDGVPEATDANEEMFGAERMVEALRSREDGTPEEILGAVRQSVAGFVGNAQQFDDLTMLCVQYMGPAAPPSEAPAEP
ncbi:MAG: SpoIIE family protein phosphatase [Clostridia bacterium]|nr:SpoIIE family protein phosphatase [Clostridia bacterium]